MMGAEHGSAEMKIVYIPEGFPHVSETFVFNEIWGMVNRGHEVRVESRLAGEADAWNYGRCAELRGKVPAGTPSRRPSWRDLPLALRRAGHMPLGKHPRHLLHRVDCALRVADLCRRIRRHRPDAMVVHFGFDNAIAAAICARKLGIPLVQWLHGSDYYVQPHRSLSWLTDQCGAVLTCSAYAGREVQAAGVTAPVYPNNLGISLELFCPDPNVGKEKRPTIITVARLGHNKNHERHFRVFAEVKKALPDAQLWLVGQGKKEAALRELAGQMGLADSIVFQGPVLTDGLINLLRRAWVKALLSDQEGLGVALMEAMACGTPCIASDLGGVPEVVTDGKTGVLVDWNRENAEVHAAGKLVELLRDHDLRERYRQASLADARIRFDEHRQVDRLENLLKELVEKRPISWQEAREATS
jgi:glycosyltransferase involved in cell wall biosynthesis